MLSSIHVSNLSLTRPWTASLPRMRRGWEAGKGRTQSEPLSKTRECGQIHGGAHSNQESILMASLLELRHSLPMRSIKMARQPQPSVPEPDRTTAVVSALGCIAHCPLCGDCDTLSRMLPATFDGMPSQQRQARRSTTQGHMMYPSAIIQRMTA
jgi:hypothetical protein